jgi:2-methylisocitrate lyase-like PEP mutase family enzyme
VKPTTRFRRLLKRPGLILAPFVFDAYQAKIAEEVGFRLLYMTGFGTAAARGYPDVGLVTQTEMVENARYIASAVRTPLLCDADTGYGNPINVWRTVREYEAAGVAGIHIEDQVFPKKCGFFAGKQVVPLEEHVQKVRAALDARRDKDFVIIARTDALAVHGWEDTLRRCRAYYEAGADMVFVDGIRTEEDLEVYARELRDIPKLYNGMLRPAREIERMGFKVMIAGGTMGVIYKALREAFRELKRKGAVSPSRMEGLDRVASLLGLPRIYEMERRYGAPSPPPRV